MDTVTFSDDAVSGGCGSANAACIHNETVGSELNHRAVPLDYCRFSGISIVKMALAGRAFGSAL